MKLTSSHYYFLATIYREQHDIENPYYRLGTVCEELLEMGLISKTTITAIINEYELDERFNVSLTFSGLFYLFCHGRNGKSNDRN